MGKFHKGDRVTFSEEYKRVRITLKQPDRLGTISGEPKHPYTVGVIWDGAKTPERYHVDFLDPVSSK